MISIKVHIFCCALLIFIVFVPRITESYAINKSDLNDSNNDSKNVKENVPDDEGIIFDNYPMVVPKRAALLLDRLMVALHHALEDDDKGAKKINEVYGGRGYSNSYSKIESKPRTNFIATNDEIESEQDLDTRDISSGQYGRQDDMMGLQRRGHDDSGKGRVYWRCYFNAVTCF